MGFQAKSSASPPLSPGHPQTAAQRLTESLHQLSLHVVGHQRLR